MAAQNLQVRTLTAVGSASFLALADATGTDPLLRRDGAGAFTATGAYGTALLALNAAELLLGGPAAPGGVQSVLQRSSDAGSSTTVVSSLVPNVPLVYDLFQVRSGTLLASAHSGGIFRSTDAGSSWSLTQTISGAFHIQRFFSPRSGTLWGGTGFSDIVAGQGLYIWQSTDAGISWKPLCTVHTSGLYKTSGWYGLTGSEWLLSHFGTGVGNLAVLRAAYSSPSSIAWVPVLGTAAFAEVLRTDSGHLLFGYDEDATLAGGATYRSLDQGSSWSEDGRLAKVGNVRALRNADGTVDAYVTRMSVGARTDRYRNFTPDDVT